MLGRDFEDEVRSRSVFELACNPIGYFGKMNSTLGSVVPLAMFLIMTPIKIKMTSTWREQFTISHNLKKLKTTTKYSPKISDDEGDVQTNTNLFVDLASHSQPYQKNPGFSTITTTDSSCFVQRVIDSLNDTFSFEFLAFPL